MSKKWEVYRYTRRTHAFCFYSRDLFAMRTNLFILFVLLFCQQVCVAQLSAYFKPDKFYVWLDYGRTIEETIAMIRENEDRYINENKDVGIDKDCRSDFRTKRVKKLEIIGLAYRDSIGDFARLFPNQPNPHRKRTFSGCNTSSQTLSRHRKSLFFKHRRRLSRWDFAHRICLRSLCNCSIPRKMKISRLCLPGLRSRRISLTR